MKSLQREHGTDVINHFLRQNPFEKGESTAAVDALGRAARAGELKQIADSLPKKTEAAQATTRFSFTEWNSHESISRTVSNAISAWHYTEKKTLPPGTLEKVTPQLISEILESTGDHPVIRGCQEAIRVLAEQKEASKYDDSVRQLNEAIASGKLREVLDYGKEAPAPSVISRVNHEGMAEELRKALRSNWHYSSPEVLEKVTPELMREILDLENHHPDVKYYRKLLGIVMDRSDADTHFLAVEELGRAIRGSTLRKVLDHGKAAPKPRPNDALQAVIREFNRHIGWHETAESDKANFRAAKRMLKSDDINSILEEEGNAAQALKEILGKGWTAPHLAHELAKRIKGRDELEKLVKRNRPGASRYDVGGGIRQF